MADMKLYSHDEALDIVQREKGTIARDNYETEMSSYLMGEAIREARISCKLTQEQLGEKMGIRRAQVSKIENGRNLTISTISRAFKAMGIPVSLDVSGVGKVALW